MTYDRYYNFKREYEGFKTDEELAEAARERRHKETLQAINESGPFNFGGVSGLIGLVFALWLLKLCGAF